MINLFKSCLVLPYLKAQSKIFLLYKMVYYEQNVPLIYSVSSSECESDKNTSIQK